MMSYTNIMKRKDTDWDPASVNISLNICLEACIVPSSTPSSSRLSVGHIIVIDDFVPENIRTSIQDLVTEKDWHHEDGPPLSKWERETCDQVGLQKTWGLKDDFLNQLKGSENDAIIETQSRISKLYPEYEIIHMPSKDIQDPSSEYDCNSFVCNAATFGDSFSWHVDADPWTFPNSDWVKRFGNYFNGEDEKPLFVSVLLYLNEKWEMEWNAETLFLDTPTDTGIFVRPKPGRAVFMDQDVMHRVSAPSALAGRPRYSLVWKLVFLPKFKGQKMCIARKEWGSQQYYGSAFKAIDIRNRIFDFN